MISTQEKDEQMWALANRLAQSGEYRGWSDIEWELSALGYGRARALLGNASIRKTLDSSCAHAGAVHGADHL